MQFTEATAQRRAETRDEYVLLHALTKNDRERAVNLLSKDIDPNFENEYGSAPLMLAIQSGDFNLVMLLIYKGADINYQPIKSTRTLSKKNTLLDVAIQKQDTVIAGYLLKIGSNITPQLQKGTTKYNNPLVTASITNNIDIVKFLLRNGAEIDTEERELLVIYHILANQNKKLIDFWRNMDSPYLTEEMLLENTKNYPVSSRNKMIEYFEKRNAEPIDNLDENIKSTYQEELSDEYNSEIIYDQEESYDNNIEKEEKSIFNNFFVKAIALFVLISGVRFLFRSRKQSRTSEKNKNPHTKPKPIVPPAPKPKPPRTKSKQSNKPIHPPIPSNLNQGNKSNNNRNNSGYRRKR